MTASLILAVFIAGQASPHQARKEVEEVYHRFARCWEREDVVGLAKIMHPDGVTIGLDGSRWSFRNVRRDLVPMFENRRKGRMRIRIEQFEVFGHEAQVWLTSTESFERKTKTGWRVVTGSGRFYERLANDGARWRIIESIDVSDGRN